MTGSGHRPLLFLDVDGPLIPFGAARYPTYQAGLESEAGSNPLLARVNPEHGPRLAALPCDLVWATTWMADANEQDERAGLRWKTRALVDWAAGRSFAWVDDEITGTDRAWVSAHHRGQALLHRVDPREGLTDADYTSLAEWLSLYAS